MKLIHLPTLDGSTEAAVARLGALGRLQDISAIEDGVWQADSLVSALLDLVPDRHGAYGKALVLRASHEAVLTGVQIEIDRLVAT